MAWAKKLWTLRWSLLKQPSNLSGEEKQAITALESEDEGLVHSFRSLIRQLGCIGKKGATYAAFFRGVTTVWDVSRSWIAAGC
jgi:hypothetical protein